MMPLSVCMYLYIKIGKETDRQMLIYARILCMYAAVVHYVVSFPSPYSLHNVKSPFPIYGHGSYVSIPFNFFDNYSYGVH